MVAGYRYLIRSTDDSQRCVVRDRDQREAAASRGPCKVRLTFDKLNSTAANIWLGIGIASAVKALAAMKERIREITSRTKG